MFKHLNQSITAFVFVMAALLLSGQAFADHGRRSSPVIVKTIYQEIYRPVINYRIKHDEWRHKRRYRDDRRQWHDHNPSYRQRRQAHRFENRDYKPKHFYRRPHYKNCRTAEPKRHRSGIGYRNSNNGVELVVGYYGR